MNLSLYGDKPMTGAQMADAIAHIRSLRMLKTEQEIASEVDAVLTNNRKLNDEARTHDAHSLR